MDGGCAWVSTVAMARAAQGIALALLMVLATGCTSPTPEQRAAAQRAWAERNEQRRAECARQGLPYFDGACISRGGP
jgi:hypothetical protein